VSRGWLSVFAKAPQESAAALYAAMLADVLVASVAFAQRLGLSPVLHFDPPDAQAEFERVAPAGYRLRPQRGSGLAERMANAFDEAAAEGAERMLLRGSDSPGLDLPVVAAALAGLEAGSDLVLTPDQGGGYALIALKEPRRELFEVVLSTGSVLEETLARARAIGLFASLTPATFDLDVVGDLARFDDLPPDRASVLCPRTVEIIRDFRARAVL
jgi:glycosyltransferase A (GT-A) superfamily protein (DUF2064 family)